jgi:hypothetical protein
MSQLLDQPQGNVLLRPQDMTQRGIRAFPGTYDANFGARPDGSAKGAGFLGVLAGRGPNKGQAMTEFSVGVEIDGQQMEIPTLVPTLTPNELNLVLNGKITDEIVRKAADHARARLAQGQGVFADPNFNPSYSQHGGGR